jgi:hypothetical protein
MTTVPLEIPLSQDVPVESVKRSAIAAPAGNVSNFATETPHEEWQSRLRSLQQWICELLIKNQQLRCALMEIKKLEQRDNEDHEV